MTTADECVERVEVCSLAAARRVAAMLDLDPAALVDSSPLPPGWHFILLGADTRRSELRADGFPGLGVPMPDLGFSRLMLSERSVSYLGDVAIGSTLNRRTCIKDLTLKNVKSGPMAIVTIEHELRAAHSISAAIVETQTYLLLSARSRTPENSEELRAPESGLRTMRVVPDETLLFQYSALGFNSHKIHLDKTYASEVEGFPGLVVNGGLVTLLLTEFLRRELSLVPAAIRVRHLVPLFCGRPITLTADRDGPLWRLQAFDDKNRAAVKMEVRIR